MRRQLLALAAVLAGPAQAAEHLVVMSGHAYEPDALTAWVGDSVRFANRDRSDHAVLVPAVGHAIHLGRQAPGEDTVLRLGRPGRLEVECVLHPDMLLTVEVRP